MCACEIDWEPQRLARDSNGREATGRCYLEEYSKPTTWVARCTHALNDSAFSLSTIFLFFNLISLFVNFFFFFLVFLLLGEAENLTKDKDYDGTNGRDRIGTKKKKGDS